MVKKWKMKDDHERGTHLLLGAIMILVLALIFVAFGKTIYSNVNSGYERNSIIDNAANDKYVVDGPDLKKELNTSNE